MFSFHRTTAEHEIMVLNNLAHVQGGTEVFPRSPVEEMSQLSGYVCSEPLGDLQLISIVLVFDGNQPVTRKKVEGISATIKATLQPQTELF